MRTSSTSSGSYLLRRLRGESAKKARYPALLDPRGVEEHLRQGEVPRSPSPVDVQQGGRQHRVAEAERRRGELRRDATTVQPRVGGREERGITEALAHDRDFEQAGFTALLRRDR